LKLVFDTNIYCDYAEGVPEVVDVLATHGERFYMPSIVVGELTYGFLRGSRQAFNERKLKEILAGLQIEIISVNAEVGRKYALICRALEKKGRRIPVNDAWIAACCMEVGGTLLTRDRHFEQVDQIDAMVLKG
jgi:predicted nucleic acid-binding protein